MEDSLHIGIIMDGNRRFAKRLMKNPSMGHEWGAKKVGELVDWCKDLNIDQLTLYSLSLENFNRPKREFDYLMNVFRKEFDKLKDDVRISENRIRIRVIGRISMLPEDIQEKIHHIVDKTKDHEKYTINFALAYGGRGEIIDAVKRIAEEIEDKNLSSADIDEKTFERYLYMDDSPDLIIRTGGDYRTSNFLCYQSAYSEWFFLEKMWPEFERSDLKAVIDSFRKRERRFGH